MQRWYQDKYGLPSVVEQAARLYFDWAGHAARTPAIVHHGLPPRLTPPTPSLPTRRPPCGPRALTNFSSSNFFTKQISVKAILLKAGLHKGSASAGRQGGGCFCMAGGLAYPAF